MNDVDRIRQMVADGQITPEEGENLIAVLQEVDAAGERLAAAGSARSASADRQDDLPDEKELDAEFDRAFEAEYESQLSSADAAQTVPDPRSGAADPAASGGSERPVEPAQPPQQESTQPVQAQDTDHGARAADSNNANEPDPDAGPGYDDPVDRNLQEAMSLHATLRAAQEARERARDQAQEAMEKAREAAREAARQGRDAAREAMRTARDAAREAAREARRASRDAARTSRDAMRAVSADLKGAAEQPDEASRPGAGVAPAGTKWLSVEMLAGELKVKAVPGLTGPVAEGGPGHFDIQETDDGYRIQFMPERGTFIDRIVTSLKSGELKVQVPPDYGLNLQATAGDVTMKGVRYLRGRMRAGELNADRLEGVDFGMTAGEFTATIDPRPGFHIVTIGAGDLNVRLPHDVNARVKGRVSIGDADARVNGLHRTGSGLGGSIEGTLGDGSATLDLRVTTGDLDVMTQRSADG